MSCEPITGCVIQSSTFGNKARLVDLNDVPLLQAGVTSITWKCFNASEVLIDSGTLVVVDVLSDTLLTTGWAEDSIGYNFVHAVGDDVCIVAGVHLFEYEVTITGGQKFTTPQFKPTVQARLTS